MCCHVEQDRALNNLLPIIQANIEESSYRWSDELMSDNRLHELGYHHDTVNHSECFVDPVTKGRDTTH